MPTDRYETQILCNDFDALPTVSTDKWGAVEVYVTAGYASTKTPEAIQQALLLLITGFYEKREDTIEKLPKASTNLLRAFRFYR